MFKYKITHYLKVKFKHAKSDQPTGGTSVSPSDTENDVGLGSLLGFCFSSPLYAALCSTTYTVTESPSDKVYRKYVAGETSTFNNTMKGCL